LKIRGKIDTFQAGYFLAIDLHIELVGYFIGCQYAVSTETFAEQEVAEVVVREVGLVDDYLACALEMSRR